MPSISAYHGTNCTIDAFRPLSHFGSYHAAYEFASDHRQQDQAKMVEAELASMYDEEPSFYKAPDFIGILHVELDIKRPLHVFDSGTKHDVGSFLGDVNEALVKHGQAPLSGEIKDQGQLIDRLTARGFDGLVYQNRREDVGHTSWAVFTPQQARIQEQASMLDPAFEAFHQRHRQPPFAQGHAVFQGLTHKAFAQIDQRLERAWKTKKVLGALTYLEVPEGAGLVARALNERFGGREGTPTPKILVQGLDGHAAALGPKAFHQRLQQTLGGDQDEIWHGQAPLGRLLSASLAMEKVSTPLKARPAADLLR